MELTFPQIEQFRHEVWSFYEMHGRADMPWRKEITPYGIFISEVMLQQTQVERVKFKYIEFVAEFPNFAALRDAKFVDVARKWDGLGYNRRARWLQQGAGIIMREFDGVLPSRPESLQRLPGIGPHTAGSISAFAYEQPSIFIETNIRSLYVHYFFQDVTRVEDAQIYSLVAQTLEVDRPREWYWALMDYGSHIKRVHKNPSRRSAIHRKQSRFEGSMRQLRGVIMRELLQGGVAKKELIDRLDDSRVEDALARLSHDGLITCKTDSNETVSLV